MKLIKSAVIAPMLFLAATSVSQADPLSFTNPFSSNAGGTQSTNPVYIGGSLGTSSVDSFCDGQNNCDDSDMGWKVFAGYDFSERIAFEVGYNSLGEMQSSTKKTKITGYELAAVGKMPLNDQIGLFGKAGLFRWEAKNDDGKRSAFDILFGAGVDYKINGNMSVRGEWERFNDIETKSNDTSDIDMLSLGFTYRTM
jgi:OOP family OmpA-OmpF porin